MTNKEKLAIPPQPMPEQAPSVRRRNMKEVALGYTPEQAQAEASRCLHCANKPCVSGCPVAIDIPRFLAAAAEGRFSEALGVIHEHSLLPAICGRVCPQERQCQAHCTVGKVLKDVNKAVAIGRVERFCADNAKPPEEESSLPPRTGKRVAVVGAGPAGIIVAGDCARAGHEVTLFEALHKPGGVLVYGIPEFRLPKTIVRKEVAALEKLGVKIRTNVVIGRTFTIESLLSKPQNVGGESTEEDRAYDAVFVGTGAGLPKFMGIPGENLVGVFSANEYLTRANLMHVYDRERSETPRWVARRVAVLGGGNVAMDAARMALRLGAEEVHLFYRRSFEEIPARAEEIHHAQEEGVEFHILQSPSAIIGDENDRVVAIKVQRFELGDPDESGRRSPIPVEGADFLMELDTVIVAIGNASNPLIAMTTPELAVDRHGRIKVDENGETSIKNLFAGGDIVLGAATIILAMGEGRRAAAAINKRLAAEN